MENPGPPTLVGDPPLKFRFSVFFYALGSNPNPLDTLFQKVSGIGSSIDLSYTIAEGGQNLFTHRLPTRVQYENLSLERGLVIASPISDAFNQAMTRFKFNPTNVLVTLLDEAKNPIQAWQFMNVYPVRWNLSDLDANDNNVAIESMELAYQRMQTMAV